MSSKKMNTRAKILESAWALLEEGTGDAVRMSDIAKRAGISRQALYLHFPKRADLLIATTRYLDEVKNADARFDASREATSGLGRLAAFVEAWGNYIPEIHGVAKALMAMQETDQEAAEAWNDRMQAVRHGCNAAVDALGEDGALQEGLSSKQAVDLLWTILSVPNWRRLTVECGWSQSDYVAGMTRLAMQMLVKDDARPAP